MVRQWSETGLFKDGVLMSFEQLVYEYNIPSSHYFRYQQVCVFVRKHFPSFLLLSPPLIFYTFSYTFFIIILFLFCNKVISPTPEIAIFCVTPAGMAVSGVQSHAIAFFVSIGQMSYFL